MKTWIAALCLISTAAFAQNAETPVAPPRRLPVPMVSASAENGAEFLPDNYLVRLVVAEKDQEKTELSVVVATTTQFNASAVDTTLSFIGMLVPQENGVINVRYTLNIQVPVTEGSSNSFRSSACSSSVRMRLGETVQIFKSGAMSYKLTVSKLAADKEK
jgi:hypothetical protein